MDYCRRDWSCAACRGSALDCAKEAGELLQGCGWGGGELALCHVASARSFAVRGALPAGGDSVDGDGGTSGAVAGCEVEAGVTAPRSGPGSLSVRFAQIAAMSVPVEAERASLATDVVRALTAEVVTPDVHRALPVGVVQSVSSPQTASVTNDMGL